ncbi:hypothetical protein T492DRAFT_1134133 [Pavlovales sp. CCMP2436]|nr:hypothetical protein T492DRAFT_1134133 [Pavlovales sp. CCMP2436]
MSLRLWFTVIIVDIASSIILIPIDCRCYCCYCWVRYCVFLEQSQPSRHPYFPCTRSHTLGAGGWWVVCVRACVWKGEGLCDIEGLPVATIILTAPSPSLPIYTGCHKWGSWGCRRGRKGDRGGGYSPAMISTAPSPSLPISAGDRTLALTNRTEALKDGVTRTLAAVLFFVFWYR